MFFAVGILLIFPFPSTNNLPDVGGYVNSIKFARFAFILEEPAISTEFGVRIDDGPKFRLCCSPPFGETDVQEGIVPLEKLVVTITRIFIDQDFPQ